jgi:nucleoside phosphorylase
MAGASSKEIKNRIRSMKSTRQITKAMEMVAASKLRRAQAQILSSRPYFQTLYETIQDIAGIAESPSVYLTSRPEKPTLFVADKALCEKARQAAETVLPTGSKAIDGVVASGDIFVDDSALKAQLRDGFGAAAAEMEGAAIAQAAVANGIPFVILRTISDLAEHQANVSFDELEQYVGKLAGDITVALLADL